MTVAALSSAFMLYASSLVGLSGVWSGLTLFMGMRIVAGYMRLVMYEGKFQYPLHFDNSSAVVVM